MSPVSSRGGQVHTVFDKICAAVSGQHPQDQRPREPSRPYPVDCRSSLQDVCRVQPRTAVMAQSEEPGHIEESRPD